MTDKPDILDALDAIARVQVKQEYADTLNQVAQLLLAREMTIGERDTTIRDQRAEIALLRQAESEKTRQIDGLLDQMHLLTLENARHQGYLDRVREFDPVADKVAYEDELVSVPRRVARAPRIIDEHSPVWRDPNLNHANGGSETARRPWYRLRG